MFKRIAVQTRQLRPMQLVRTYADAPVTDKLRLTLACPNKVLYEKQDVTQVNLPSTAGRIGVLANHVPSVEELTPGVVDVITGAETKSFFVAGGFATVTEGSELKVSAMDAYPLSAFNPQVVQTLLAEAQKNAASGDEEVAKQAKIELELLEALAAAVKA